jgi:hypothetical protein
MAAWLKRARTVIDEHADFFHPKPIDDAALLARLDEIGPYEVDLEGRNISVRWDGPRGFDCEWTSFSVTIVFPAKKKADLQQRLDTLDRLRRRWSEHQSELKSQVLASFDNYFEQQPNWFDDYESGPDGRPTATAILQHAGAGGIRIGGEDEPINVFFHVDWDDEHGLEVSLDDEPDPDPTDDVAAAVVRFHDPGPALSEADLTAFETRHELTLPAEYRAFLLRTNGGTPEPNSVKVKGQGGLVLEILFLSSLSDVDAELAANLRSGRPKHLLPIGYAKIPFPGMFGEAEASILLRASGTKSGQVLVSMADAYAAMPGVIDEQRRAMVESMSAMYEAQCLPVASNFTLFLSRLGVPAEV